MNTIAFDDWLRQQHGEYDADREISMVMLIAEQYSPAARDWARSAI